MKSRSLVLLSGEGTTVPAAEAKALFLTYDPESRFTRPEPRVLIVETSADPIAVGARIAFARRVGHLVEGGDRASDLLSGRSVRFRTYDLRGEARSADPGRYLRGLDVTVDLRSPDYELSLVRGEEDYLVVTAPLKMNQEWSKRRPRRRPFFHPSAMLPKISRAMVNLSRCREGQAFLDPFTGTGSIPMEAYLVGAEVVALDLAGRMARGALQNMSHFGQRWSGMVRADAASLPVRRIGAVATDVPYGRASSTRGRSPREMLGLLLPQLSWAMSPRSHVVLMHPQQEPVPDSEEFSVLEEHHLHVHKLLTRTITVLERR